MTDTTRTRRPNRQGTFVHRKDGRYEYQIMVEGRRVSGYGRTKTAAKAKADEKIKTLGAVRSAITLQGLFDQWEAVGWAELGLAPTTFDQYRALMRSQVLPTIGGKRVDALTKSIMVGVMNGITAAPSTKRSTYAALVRVLEYARSQGTVGTNVMRSIDRPRAGKTEPRDVTDGEAVAILKAAKGHRWEVAVWLGLGAGLRRGEMLGLTWSDVDLATGVAEVVGNVTRSSAGLRRADPKTRRGKRIIPLPAEVVTALRRHRRVQAAERLRAGAAWSDSDAVLANEVGGVGEPRTLSRVWQGWARAANVEDTGTHVGRHFAASTLLASGHASVADVAAMLGHDPAVLLNTYAAPVATGQRAAATALGAVLSKPRKASK